MSLLLDATTASTTSVPFGTNNRWNAGGAGYDARGNLTGASASPNSFTATYDAENRQIQTSSTDGGVSETVNYAYDGDGKRVTKAVTGGATTTYLYDAKGHLSAEYSTATNPDSGTQYLTSDPLGSTRLITTGTTTPVKSSCSDYLPFGQEIPTTWGARNCTPDASETIKFTRKERDPETGLDFFEARYFSSAQGRFTSPDWSENPEPVPYADLRDPQSLNLYTYGRNNPLKNRDIDGHCTVDGEIHGGFWCFLHAIGFADTKHEQANALRTFYKGWSVYGVNGKKQSVSSMSDNEVLAFNREQTLQLAAVNWNSPSGLPPGLMRVQLLSRAQDSGLRNIINDLYKETSSFGDGGTADAIEYERATGQTVGGRYHTQKGQEYSKALEKAIGSGRLNAADKEIAQNLLDRLKEALTKTK